MKKVSTFLDFELKTTKKEVLDEFGISKKKARKITAVPFVLCPLCALSRPLRRTGAYHRVIAKGKGKRGERAKEYNPELKTTFDKFDLENAPFISIRKPMGRGKGIPEIAIIRFQDIPKLPEADKEIILPLIKQIQEKCMEVLNYIDELKI